MNSKYIECVVVILFTLLFCFLNLCWRDYLSSECVVYNIIGGKCDIM